MCVCARTHTNTRPCVRVCARARACVCVRVITNMITQTHVLHHTGLNGAMNIYIRVLGPYCFCIMSLSHIIAHVSSEALVVSSVSSIVLHYGKLHCRCGCIVFSCITFTHFLAATGRSPFLKGCITTRVDNMRWSSSFIP